MSVLSTLRNYIVQHPARSFLLITLVVGGVVIKFSANKQQLNVNQNVSVDTEEAEKGKSFQDRLKKILSICIPSYTCKESLFLIALSALLVARTVMSVIIAEGVAGNVRALVSKEWGVAVKGVFNFFLLSFPAALINTFIKHLSIMLGLKFRVRLSTYVNSRYVRGVNFYYACNLKGINDVDQRVTHDIEQVCDEISSLYSAIFKPILDLVLFTNQLVTITGWQGPALMYSYFLVSAFIKKIINTRAAFGQLVAEQSKREGAHRTAHQRLITNSEEIAFYDGSDRERGIIHALLKDLYQYAKYHTWIRSAVGICDQLLVKYWATIAGYGVMWVPIYFSKGSAEKSVADLTRDYARISRYLENLANAVGQLVLVINAVATISGRTRRVGELIEVIEDLNTKPMQPFKLRIERKVERNTIDNNPYLKGLAEWLENWRSRQDVARKERILSKQTSGGPPTRSLPGGGTYVEGDIIQFKEVDVVSPEGSVLAKDMTFTVAQQQNCMITGPNGAGKSSLFRVIGELWPLSKGIVVKPPKEDFLFVPQKPYLVKGTMRDQIIYPHSLADMKKRCVTDEDLARLLAVVDPANDILSTWSFDDKKDWFRAFSGGQKQRIAMARVFYHRPLYAILDECTSAVSSEVENKIYEACRTLGITIFTVSHRDSLRIHHDYILYIEGQEGRWKMTDIRNER